MKSYPALAIAQYVDGSVAPKRVPPVTFLPCINFALAGFQPFDPARGSNAVPYFQVAGSKGPELTAPAGGVAFAPLSLPAGAARGNCCVPASGLFRYGSALGVCGRAGACPGWA